MKIQFRQSGGFAGLTRGCEIDEESMSPAERDRVESLLRQSGLVDNAARPAARAMPDQRQYHLQVQREDGRTAEASFGESQLNAAGAELVQFLNARSAPMPRR